MKPVFAYITTKDKAQAREIGRALVELKLAACVNIIEGMESIYRWEGKIESASECVLIAKTSKALFGALTEEVRKRHSYECPCVLEIPIGEGNPDYVKWLEGNVRSVLK